MQILYPCIHLGGQTFTTAFTSRDIRAASLTVCALVLRLESGLQNKRRWRFHQIMWEICGEHDIS